MTEEEWLRSESPYRMFACLGRTVSARKLRLFGIACCRRIWHLMPDDDARRAVELAELLAEGDAPAQEVAELRERLKALHLETFQAASQSKENQVAFWCRGAARGTLQAADAYEYNTPIRPGDPDLLRVWTGAASAVGHSHDADFPVEVEQEHTAQAALLRDILGTPMRPTRLRPEWRTRDVVDRARSIYEDAAFDRLPDLWQALRSAGCGDADIEKHCESPGPHVRGCWVVDLILGRK